MSDHQHGPDCNHDHDHNHDHKHDHGHDDHDAHGHPTHAGEIIPETSMQDMLLKLVTVVAAGLLIGTMGCGGVSRWLSSITVLQSSMRLLR